MKLYLNVLILISGIFTYAQVKIGGTDGVLSSTTSDLELAETEKGLVLPYVISTASVDANSAVNGTLVFDSSDFKVKFKTATGWFDYSLDITGNADMTSQQNLVESTDAGVVIGDFASTDRAPGILVLSSKNKGMILPKVIDPDLNIKSPSAGMMVFDPSTQKLCVFNGSKWSFWEAE